MKPAHIARVCHEANRALQLINNEEYIAPGWDSAPQWQCESALDGVNNALAGATPQESHENWLKFKAADGWTYGPVRDNDAKVHPCMVSYDELPAEQRVKDRLFTAIVNALRPANAE